MEDGTGTSDYDLDEDTLPEPENKTVNGLPDSDASSGEEEATKKRRKSRKAENEKNLPKVLPSPLILYQNGSSAVESQVNTNDPVLGNIYLGSDGYKFFQTNLGMDVVLQSFLNDAVLESYCNTTLPVQFQGSAFVVIKIEDSQKAGIINFLKNDGNGGWEQSRTGYGPLTDGQVSRQFIRIYYRSDAASGFKRIISYLVPDSKSREIVSNFAVVQYYWSDGSIPKVFVCKAQRSRSGKSSPSKTKSPYQRKSAKEHPESDDTGFSFSTNPSLEKIRRLQEKFTNDRGWDEFHTPRNLLLAMVGEVGEVSELFQWKGEVQEGLPDWSAKDKESLEQELADVLIYLVRLADKCHVDLPKAVERKIQLNAVKYPVDKVFGSAKKYTEYEQT